MCCYRYFLPVVANNLPPIYKVPCSNQAALNFFYSLAATNVGQNGVKTWCSPLSISTELGTCVSRSVVSGT